MTENYQRVIPRDLFNESKLLKCLGQLALKIHGGAAGGLTLRHADNRFDVLQDDSSGDLYVDNLHFKISHRYAFFCTAYNARSAYPLQCVFQDEMYLVFDETGEFTGEFTELIKIGDKNATSK